tara:strand:+ start:322 stop:642 length:321 start_codon:yes stop_codon:yes gene_type:complete
MAVTRYHNIDGSSKSIVELIPPFGGANTLKSIMINTLTTSGTPEVELFIQRPTDTGTDKFSIISGVKVPVDCSLVLDNSMFSITNSFGLYIKLDTNSTADVLLNLV